MCQSPNLRSCTPGPPATRKLRLLFPLFWTTSSWLLQGSRHVPMSTSRPRPQRSGIGPGHVGPRSPGRVWNGNNSGSRGWGWVQESSSWLKHNRSLERRIINSSFYNREPEVRQSEMINPSVKRKTLTSTTKNLLKERADQAIASKTEQVRRH